MEELESVQEDQAVVLNYNGGGPETKESRLNTFVSSRVVLVHVNNAFRNWDATTDDRIGWRPHSETASNVSS